MPTSKGSVRHFCDTLHLARCEYIKVVKVFEMYVIIATRVQINHRENIGIYICNKHMKTRFHLALDVLEHTVSRLLSAAVNH